MHLLKSQHNGIFFETALPQRPNGTTIILLPGLPEYPRPRALMVSLCEKGFAVVYPRYRGTFESEGVFLDHNPAQDILELLELFSASHTITEQYGGMTFSLPDAFVLVGTSFGGSVALQVCSSTKLVSRCIIAAPVINFAKEDPAWQASLRSLGRFLAEGFPQLYRLGDAGINLLIEGSILPVPAHLHAKVIVLHSDDDAAVPIEDTEAFAAKHGLRFIKYSGKGHMGISSLSAELIISILGDD